ncbi:hypothetical protein PVNG_01553 [Plasmodium vivax North Korean]|uniref:VIR protein n=1 Tax=Plasmodium vivax North Korean TaxID=1035514 RepID=A0A0J9WFH1_PLAVI|nr:hypothetical protein PVNG_01553 [Plasmodium vivax North Korean]
MAKKPPKPWYFKYKEYSEIKKSFVYKPDSDFNISFVNEIIKLIPNTITKEEELYATFYQLKKFISRNHSFYEYNPDNCCNYINYWLNKTVRDSKYGIDEHNFKYFDDFMQLDPKASDGPFNCISKLSYMDTDTFHKMEKLYELYDYFTELKESDDPSSLCRNISNMAAKYKGMMQECKDKDNNLCDVLKNLKYLIDTDKLVAKNICKTNIFDLFYLKIDTPRKEQKAFLYDKHMNHQKQKKQKNTDDQKDYKNQSNHKYNYKKKTKYID